MSIPSVLGHLLQFIRLVDEFDLGFASKYELHLQKRLQELIKTRGNDLDISDRIMTLDSSIMADLRLDAAKPSRAAPSKGNPLTPTKASKGRGKGSGGSSGKATPSKAPKAAQQSTPRSSAPARGGSKGGSSRICFDHDPSRNSSCPRGKNCQHLHLDTRQAGELERYARAQAASNAAKAARAALAPR